MSYYQTMKRKKPTLKQLQAVRCPTCGAAPGEKCELVTGQPRTESHRDRREIAAEKGTSAKKRRVCDENPKLNPCVFIDKPARAIYERTAPISF